MITKNLFCLALLLTSLNLFAQKAPFKFGKVTEDELLLDKCDFFSEANSMILGEFGELDFIYNNQKGWQYHIKVLVRKKIFKNTDKDVANISLELYEPSVGSNKEEITSLKAITYNLEGKEITKSKLTSSEKFETRLNDYWVKVSFALPDVREGSVIEYEYSIVSDYISNLKTWYFQQELPVAYSEFRFTIPEFFKYQKNMVGYYHPTEISERDTDENFTYQYTSAPGVGGKIEKGTGTLPSRSTVTTMTAKNVLPVQDEPFMNNKADIPCRLEFQLMSVQMPHQPVEYVAGTYEKFTNELMDRSDFGLALNRGNFAKDEIEKLSGKSDLEKASLLYNWLTNHFSWNGNYSFVSDKAGRQAYNDAKGSVADINLALVAALKEAGLNASPIILSTRGHGIVHPIYPSYSDFNYVVAGVTIDNSMYYADATSGYDFGKLPVRCLNGNGLLVAKSGSRWVDLKSNAKHSTAITSKISFEDGRVKSSMDIKEEDYSAMFTHSELKKEGNESYAEKLSESFPEWSIENFEYDGESNRNKTNMKMELSQEYDNESVIYLSPILHGAFTENPFKRDDRFSPIDLEYSINKRVVVTIEIPDGYAAELPQPAIVKLANNGAQFMYSASAMGNSVTVVSNLQMNQKDFSAEEYPHLKQFFQLMADKNNEVIVLKKL